MQNIRGHLLKGSLWVSGAKVATNLLNFVGMLVLARILVPADFGLVALGTTMLAIVTAVTDIPLSEALIQHKNPSSQHFHTVWTLSIARAMLVAAVFAALAVPMASFYGDARLVNVILVLSLSVIFGGLNNPRAIMLTKDLIFWQQFMLQVSQKLAGLLITLFVALTYKTYWALLLGALGGQLAGVLISYTVLPFRPRPGLQHSRELLSFSIWLTFSKIINTINWNVDQLLIGTFVGKTELGYYMIGNNLASIPSREAAEPLMGTLFPAFSRLTDQPARLAAAYQSAQTFVAAVVWPIGVGLALVAEPVVRLTMGEKWLPAVFLIQILAPVFAFQTLGNIAQPLAMAVGKTPSLFRRDVKIFLFRVPIILLGMYWGGFAGIVWARSFTGTVGTIFNLNVVKGITGLSVYDQLKPNLRTLLGSISMALAVGAFGRLSPAPVQNLALIGHLLAMALIGAFAYLGTVAGLWLGMGRPTGPETEAIRIVRKLRGVIRPA